MDYQDPWVNDYYRQHTAAVPPGGRIKYAVADRLNRWAEPRVLRHCAGITSVSAEYPRQLRRRYPFLPSDWPVEVLPFPGDDRDLRRVETDGTQQSVFAPGGGCRNWVYVGRGGEDMHVALRGIFGALREYTAYHPGFLEDLRLHFIGTSYASAGRGRKTVEPLAAEYGLAAVVREHPDRIPYSQALRCLLDADALIVPGSDDRGYTASKIYAYILARKPLLAVFHEQSSVVDILQKTRAGTVVPFRSDEAAETIANRILATGWVQNPTVPNTLWSEFEPYTAREMTRRLCRLFESCRK
jgi:glycosyltransferase involved in cell wall biosynthesis